MRTTYAITAALLLITGTTVGVLAQDGEGPHPDLVPTELTHAPEDPIEGENTTFTATIENQGDADAESSFNVTFLVDGDRVGENRTVDSLRFGDQTQVTSDNWTAEAGDHDVRVIVDAHDDVPESDETNNERTGTVSVADAEVDLAVAEIAADPEQPIEGDDVTLEAVVENQGNVASNETALRFLVNGSALGPDATVPALEPGENATIASENWTAVEGEHTIAAFADPGREIDEADEQNNEREEDLTVEPIEANLAIDEIETDPQTPEPGEDATFTANVTNDGNSDAENVTVKFLVDGEAVSNATIEQLAAGDDATVTSDAWNGTEGEHTVRVEADVHDNVTESDEDDNAREETFTVAEEEEEENEADEPDEGDEADDGEEAGEDDEAEDEAEKMTICHVPPGNPDARHTKNISENAWQAHRDHGDHEGACEDDAESESDDEDDERAARGNGRGRGNGHGQGGD